MAEAVTMVELEGKLRSDESGALRDACLRQIRQTRTRVESQIKAGATPADYAKLNALAIALDEADFIVREYWERTHRNK